MSIDLVVEVLEKSLVIEIPNVFQRLPPYNFYAIEITVFGRQVLEKYKEQLQRVLQNPLYWRIGFSNQTKCQQTS
jgi:hypothetical protein